MKKTRLFYMAAVILLAQGGASLAAEPKLDSVSGDWNIFSLPQGGKTTCYIASAPKKRGGTAQKRGESYVLVTTRGTNVDEVSVSAGFAYKPGSEATLDIDGKKTKLFTKDDLAWAYTEKDDAALVKSMQKGSKMLLTGTSQSDTSASDSYSLSGFSKAYRRMKELCR